MQITHVVMTAITRRLHTIPAIKGAALFVDEGEGDGVPKQLALLTRHRKLFPSYLHTDII